MSKQGTRDNVMGDAARLGFMQRRMPPDFRRLEWALSCSKCSAQLVAHFASNMKPEAMAVHARRRGWDTGYGMRPLCPQCLHNKDKGPISKPDHQSFDRFMPPPTAVFDALLDAADQRGLINKVEIAQGKLRALGFTGNSRAEAVAWCDKVEAADAQKLKAEKHEAQAAVDEANKHAALRARAEHARTMRAQRIAQGKALLEARKAEIERASLQATAPDSVTPPEEQTPQVTSAPQAEEEVMNKNPMLDAPIFNQPTPSPKITHAVFQMLDDIFDAQRRLYKNGYTDQRVAKDCGTSEAVVAYLRNETFGQLAEDPRITSLRDDLELLRLQSAEDFARLQKDIAAAQSRLEQLAHR